MQIQHFLEVRCLLVFRSLADAGWGLVGFALLLSAGISFPFLLKIFNQPRPIWALVLALPAVILHFSRRDGRFLQQIGLPLYPTLLFEYLLVSLPSLLLLLASDNFLGVAVLLAAVAALPFLPLAGGRQFGEQVNNFSLEWLPGWAFEWRAGIRQMGWGFAVLWLGGLGISWWVGGLPLFGFLFAVVAISFFENLESKEILQQQFDRRGAFWQKTWRHVALAWAFLLPQSALFLLFNFQLWLLVPAVFALVGLAVAFAISLKYAGWHPGRQRAILGLPGGLFVLLAVSGVGLPAALIWLAWKARLTNSILEKYFASAQK